MKQRYVFFFVTMIILTGSLSHAIDIKNVTFNIAHFGKVIFNHNRHFEQKGIKNNCKTCHNAIFNLRKQSRYTMADMEKGQSCGVCHNGQRAFGLKECIQCHKVGDVTMKVQETGPVTFSHKRHLGVYACTVCHTRIFDLSVKKPVTMARMEKGQSCGACHNGKDAFRTDECLKCHPVKDVDFKVADAGDVLFSHELHTGMYKCGDCHIRLYLPSAKSTRRTMAEMETGKSCGACHNDEKEAFTVKENCDRCHKM